MLDTELKAADWKQLVAAAANEGLVLSKAGQPAKRVILRAIKGSKAPLTLDPGLLLHQPDGSYFPAVDAVLRQGAAFPA